MLSAAPKAALFPSKPAPNTLPEIDYIAAWDRLSRSAQDAIGVLAIKEAFLRFAATDGFVGNVTYLKGKARAAADDEADDVANVCRTLIEEEFPDLFGLSPSAEHPEGTDPDWATPLPLRARPKGMVAVEIGFHEAA